MIRIACTNCKTVLSIDDAFAGGVCRCQHCGTIQTVPAAAKSAAGVGAASSGSKALFQHGRGMDQSGTGLDDLANAIASSGLSGSGLTSRRLTAKKPPAKSMMPMFIGIGAVILMLVAIIVWLVMRSPDNRSATNNGPSAGNVDSTGSNQGTPPVNKSGPNFLGVALKGDTVIYVLDRGSSTTEVFSALKDATLKSAATLGSDHKFQIVFWNNGSDASYPKGSPTYCTKDNIDSAGRAIDDVAAFGASDIAPALQKAMNSSPDAIVIATAKGPDLDDTWTHDVLQIRGSSPLKIYGISLGSNAASPALKSLASQTGGAYREVSNSDLKSFLDSQ